MATKRPSESERGNTVFNEVMINKICVCLEQFDEHENKTNIRKHMKVFKSFIQTTNTSKGIAKFFTTEKVKPSTSTESVVLFSPSSSQFDIERKCCKC